MHTLFYQDRINELNKMGAVAKAKAEGIKNLMDSLKLTAQQGMTTLKIPESDYPKYMAML